MEDLGTRLGLAERRSRIFDKIEPVRPSEFLLKQLKEAEELPLLSEKYKSEAIVLPLLLEMRRQNNNWFTIFSGINLDVDKPLGLVGEVDFLIALDLKTLSLKSPILSLVEAKKGEIDLGIGQCVAQMYGAQLFNKARNFNVPTIYGCVTNARDWQFLRLTEKEFEIDLDIRTIDDLPQLLGVFQHIIDYYKAIK